MVFALDLRYQDLRHFINDLYRAGIYPPLFGLLAASILVIGGFDFHRVALVSLTGWIGTIVLVFLLTRQLAPSHRNAIALMAALFALGSQAHRAYATDIMLESLGTCVTLLALYLYISRRDVVSSSLGFALLGCTLTALFFLKYQYWFLTILILLLWEVISRHGEIRARLRHLWVRDDLRALVMRELHHPASWTLGGIVGLSGLLLLTGGWEFPWAGHRIRITATLNLAYAFFVVLWMRVVFIYWRHRDDFQRLVGARGMQLTWCHLLPVTFWLLWPQKLQHFLRLLSPANSYEAQRAAYWRWENLLFYPRAVVAEYHDSAWAALAAFSLLLVAFVRAPRLPVHARLVLFFLTVSAILTTVHPNHQSRYLHTWIPLLWVAGAIGLASILGKVARTPLIGATLSLAILVAIIAATAFKPLAFAFAGRKFTHSSPQATTVLDLSDYYLPRIECYEHVAIFATVPIYNFASWSYLQRYPSRRGSLTIGLKRFSPSIEVNRSEFAAWLQRTPAEAIVFIDVPEGSVFYYAHWPGEELHQQYRELVQSQTLFREMERQAFPQYESTVSILVRGEENTLPSLCQERKGG